MSELEEKSVKDFAEEYIKQIVDATDDEARIHLMKEFGLKAYSRGWKAALITVRDFIDER